MCKCMIRWLVTKSVDLTPPDRRDIVSLATKVRKEEDWVLGTERNVSRTMSLKDSSQTHIGVTKPTEGGANGKDTSNVGRRKQV